MSAFIVNINIMCRTFQLITDVDAELTSVHFPVNANKMCYNLVSMAICIHPQFRSSKRAGNEYALTNNSEISC